MLKGNKCYEEKVNQRMDNTSEKEDVILNYMDG